MQLAKIGRIGQEAAAALGRQQALDRLADPLQRAIAASYRMLGRAGMRVRNFLYGGWLGHPLHPALTDVPLGSWTAAVALEGAALLARSPGARARYRSAAELAIGVGCVGAVAAAATGLNDWQHLHTHAKRMGLVHGLLNVAGLATFAGSLLLRRRGHHAAGRALTFAGYGIALSSAYLGGTLIYHHRIGVTHAAVEGEEPRQFRAAIALDELEEDVPRRVEVDGVKIVLVRHEGQVHALGERCAHLGGPLAEGWIDRGALVCPWHGSHFSLESGRPVRGPATTPQPCFETRIRDGMVEVRRPTDR